MCIIIGCKLNETGAAQFLRALQFLMMINFESDVLQLGEYKIRHSCSGKHF